MLPWVARPVPDLPSADDRTRDAANCETSRSGNMNEPVIDIHPHIVSHDTDRYPITPIGGTRSDWSKERSVTFGELVSAMDDANVIKAAIVHSSTTYGFNNDLVADVLEGQKSRFTGVFSVNITQPDAPERIRHWHSRGMTGMRIYVRGTTIKEAWLAIDDPAFAPSWKTVADLGMSMCVNVLAKPVGIQQIRNCLEAYPSVPLIVDHLGRPPIEDGPPYELAKPWFELAKYKNLYLKLTPSGLEAVHKGKADKKSYISKLVEVFGADHIAWGSNFPSSPGSLRDIVAEAHTDLAHLKTEDRDWIFRKTAQKLYPSLA